MAKKISAKVKSVQLRESGYRLCSQFFYNKDGQTSFKVVNNSNGEEFEVTAIMLFYKHNWLKSFSCNDIRRIAYAALESELSIEQHEISLICEQFDDDPHPENQDAEV